MAAEAVADCLLREGYGEPEAGLVAPPLVASFEPVVATVTDTGRNGAIRSAARGVRGLLGAGDVPSAPRTVVAVGEASLVVRVALTGLCWAQAAAVPRGEPARCPGETGAASVVAGIEVTVAFSSAAGCTRAAATPVAFLGVEGGVLTPRLVNVSIPLAAEYRFPCIICCCFFFFVVVVERETVSPLEGIAAGVGGATAVACVWPTSKDG